MLRLEVFLCAVCAESKPFLRVRLHQGQHYLQI
jgi:hypothetical protein